MTTAVQIQLRRDTATNIAAATGAAGEPWFDTTNNRLVTNDGATAGGYPHALVANLPFGAVKNLIAGNAAGPQSFTAPAAANSQVKCVADFVSVYNATLGVSALLSSVSVTADITTSGAGGLDTGSVAANTWYSVWVIYNPASRTTAALLSTATTTPTLPSGYSYKMRVGWMLTDGSSHFLRILQQGARAQYVIGTNPAVVPNIANGSAGTVSLTSPTLASVSIASFVPPTARLIRLCVSTAWKSSTSPTIAIAPSTSWGGTNNGQRGSNGQAFPFAWFAGSGPALDCTQCELGLEGSTIAWASNQPGGAMGCFGWEDNL